MKDDSGVINITDIVYALIYSLGGVLTFQVLLNKTLTRQEKRKIGVLIICSFFVIFFWAAFEQAASSLTFIADNQTDTKIGNYTLPPSQVQNFNSIFIILFSSIMAYLWGFLQKHKMEPNSFSKQGIGLLLLALGYYIIAINVKDMKMTDKISIIWLVVLYLCHTIGELCLSPIGLSLVYKLAPKRLTSLLMGIWFVASAAGYALSGTLGALLPHSPEQFQIAAKAGISLKAVLDKNIAPTVAQKAFLQSHNIRLNYPSILGHSIQNLYDFFMVFIILCLVSGSLLILISNKLNKMSK